MVKKASDVESSKASLRYEHPSDSSETPKRFVKADPTVKINAMKK